MCGQPMPCVCIHTLYLCEYAAVHQEIIVQLDYWLQEPCDN